MNDLIQQLVSQLGVQEGQAKGGAGLLFKLAQDKLGGDFSKLTSALPGVLDLVKAAPSGGAAGALGGLASAFGGKAGGALGGLASLAGGLSQLKLDQGTLAKFVPVILAFVQGKGGDGLKALLEKAIKL